MVFAFTGLLLAAGLASAQPAPPPADDAVEPTRFWGDTVFLLGWIKNSHTPPLVSSGPAGSGAILDRGGITLFGGSVDNEARYGGRFELGYWLDDEQSVGVEAVYFFLASRTNHFGDGSNGAPGTPVIGRPFFNVNSHAQDAQLVAAPGLLAGTVGVNLESRLQGAELNGVVHSTGARGDMFRLEFLGGFRYVQLNEGLDVTENLHVLPGVPGIGGDSFVVSDQFGTGNYFYGAQFGARAEFRRGLWFLDVSGTIALGETQETADVNGRTSITPPGGPTTNAAGGLLALPTNFGHASHNTFGFVPELGVKVGYQPTEFLRVFVGYTFLYWSDVARPGDQIDYSLNPTRIPVNRSVGGPFGAAQPSFAFHETDFWAQGIQFGMEFRY